MPTLRELDARFIKRVKDENESWHEHNISLSAADGIIFLCPKCFVENKGTVGTHSVICWFLGRVPHDLTPGPGRWNPSGTGIDDLTFIGPGKVSVRLTAGCMWHGHVVYGSAS